MNIAEIRKECPKAAETFRKWMMEQFNKFTSSTGVKPESVEFTDDVLTGALAWNLRQLYDFFDGNDVEISVVQDMDRKFYFFINDNENSVLYNTRQEAEYHSFTEGFRYLENKLN